MKNFKNGHFNKIYEEFINLYYKNYLCTICFTEGHGEKFCNYCWKCNDFFDGVRLCVKCGQNRGTKKPEFAKYQPWQLEKAKEYEFLKRTLNSQEKPVKTVEN